MSIVGKSSTKKYDKLGRMAFGKHIFTLFEEVPDEYWDWVIQNCSILDLELKYPRMCEYLYERNKRKNEEAKRHA